MKKPHLRSDFRKEISPQVGLEPTKMRHDLKKSVSNLIECNENVLSFGYDFSHFNFEETNFHPFCSNSKPLGNEVLYLYTSNRFC